MSAGTLNAMELAAVEKVLGMGGGYVLDFSNRTFAMFFADLRVEIEPEESGLSKAKRLRAFLRSGSPEEVARVLTALRDRRRLHAGDESLPALASYNNTISRLHGVAVRLPAQPIHADILTLEYVRELESKADKRLSDGDLDGAITVARTLVESVLSALDRRLSSTPGNYRGDLQRQYKAVAKKLRIDDQSDEVDEGFKQIARGLVQIVNGLAVIRNKASDGHARHVKPQARHARVAVNSAKTVASFLIEVYLARPEVAAIAAPAWAEVNEVSGT